MQSVAKKLRYYFLPGQKTKFGPFIGGGNARNLWR